MSKELKRRLTPLDKQEKISPEDLKRGERLHEFMTFTGEDGS